ncbi:MAG: Na(+)-translocating NADH-quinone reductase subunit A, partial [Alistipes sp.]|nr:Na(+)-translocating NADH-quinone reductase subunit A [Alistipes sp.]
MSKIITLRKGLDINLQGKPEAAVSEAPRAALYAVSPLDFEGVTPKLLVKAGERVQAGTPLFFSKSDERVLFTSPVSGEVTAIVRGEKRKVLAVTVAPDAEQQYEEFARPDLGAASREEIVEVLLRSGLWPMIVQRPYGIIADPSDMPKAVFVSAFDSAPLAPDYDFALQGAQADLQTGIEVLRRLTSGKVHLSVRAEAGEQISRLSGAELHTFKGKHPAGNVGVQIHHIDPINKGETVWTVNIQDMAIIGRLFNTGRVDMTRTIAVAGSEVERPAYVRTIAGARVDSILGGNLKKQQEGDSVRIISGNVLTGTKTSLEGFLGYYANQLTAIPEGDKYELLGWAMPRLKKFSVSR